MKTKTIALLLAVVMLLAVTACNKADPEDNSPATTSETGASLPAQTSPEQSAPPVINQDREGNAITLPSKIEKVISIGPSNTEILTGLGLGAAIIATDEESAGAEGLTADIPIFSLYSPDCEQLTALEPDVIFVTGMIKSYGDDPLKLVSDAGICVIYIPSSNSVEGIIEDIRFIAAVMGADAQGENIVSEMEREIEAIRAIGAGITDRKKVYFEIAAAPYMYSFGKGVFLNDFIALIGAENIMADQVEWIALSEEAVLDANPDVILTTVYYIDDPVGDIISRSGWDAVTAVQNGDVYYIDANSSNRPSQNVIKALKEMAKAVYPDLY